MDAKFIPQEIIDYCERFSTNNKEISNNILLKNQSEAEAHMMIGNISSYFLRTLILLKNPKNILEIGTLFGYSTSIFLEYSSKETTVISLEENEEKYLKTKQNLIPYIKKGRLNLILSEGIKYLENTELSYDIIFIDARKDSYFDRIELLYDKLNKNGLLIIDNALAGLGTLNPTKEWHFQTNFFNEALIKHNGFNSTIIPIRDGFTLAFKL